MKVSLTLSSVDPTDESTDAADSPDDAVVIRLGVGRFAVGLAQVAEVGKVPAITRVPGVPSWLAGVANWRGRILAVLDLRSMLGAESASLGAGARLVVLVNHVASVGLVVDGVEGTTALGDAAAPVAGLAPGLGAQLISGQVPRDDGPVAVIDVDAVMGLRDSLPRSRRMA
jgi:chemotaxis signal transduction protein